MNKERFIKILHFEKNNAVKRKNFESFLDDLERSLYRKSIFFELTNDEIQDICKLHTPYANLFFERYFNKAFCYVDLKRNALLKRIDNFLFTSHNEQNDPRFTVRLSETSLKGVVAYFATGEKNREFESFKKETGITLNDFLFHIRKISEKNKGLYLFSGLNQMIVQGNINIIKMGEILDKIEFSQQYWLSEDFISEALKIIEVEGKEAGKGKEDFMSLIFSKIHDKDVFYDLLLEKVKWRHTRMAAFYEGMLGYSYSEGESMKDTLRQNQNKELLTLESIYLKSKISNDISGKNDVMKKRL